MKTASGPSGLRPSCPDVVYIDIDLREEVSTRLSVSVYLYVSFSLRLSVYLSVSVSLRLSVNLSVSVYPRISVS